MTGTEDTKEPASVYDGYCYAYPHKTAYRPLPEPVSLAEVWASEPRGSLFTYAHIPFCTRRCAYCNLFTTTDADEDQVGRYVAAMERQATAVAEALGELATARMALGGGTPTILPHADLERLFGFLIGTLKYDPASVPCSVEVSPGTVEKGKLEFLHSMGVDRISIGIQTFVDEEAAVLGRTQSREVIEQSLGIIHDFGFPVLNIDLIYGIPGQTAESWMASLAATCCHKPEEVYLYPLYLRKLTGLGERGDAYADNRLELYRLGRDELLSRGYVQESMRMFRLAAAAVPTGPDYCCQEDGMIGLGVGARSYTRGLHYSSRYGIRKQSVEKIIGAYSEREDSDLVDYGIELNGDDQRRRWLIKTILRCVGVDREAYRLRFGSDVVADFPCISDFGSRGWAEITDDRITLTGSGLERSDVIGPSLFSENVRRRMASFEWASV